MSKKSARVQRHNLSQHRLKPVYAAIMLAFSVQSAQANPTGGSVVNGSASFATSGNTLTVTNTPGTIINWQGFSINSNEITKFAQQSASSTVLNRVVGNNPSNILGTLQSNGRVFLVNPNGILFGAGAVVDVAGLVASTLNLSDADFLAGSGHFTEVPGAADISNTGDISAQQGGQIFLIAPNVENNGVITAPNGEIFLAAGHSVDLVNTNDPNLRVSITAPAGDVTNVGELIASSGSLGLFGTVVRNSGVVSADSATMEGGKIVFMASQRVEAGGTISAQGAGGGTIDLFADKQSGSVDVTGTLDASAPVSGDGGFIETSAANVLVADSAHVTTAAVGGKSGTWLIDPTDFTIVPGTGVLTTSSIGATTLATSLAGGNVTIQTAAAGTGNGDIIVNSAVSWATNKLTLSAARNIYINATLDGSLVGAGVGSLELDYGQGAINAGNTSDYFLNNGAQVNLLVGNNFSTKLGSDGSTLVYYVLDANSLGVAGDTTTATLQGMTNNTTGNYVLGADINATATSSWNGGLGFAPVAETGVFSGRFDGLGHTINGLYINRPSESYIGLFGYASGSIRNITLTGVNINGASLVGGLEGYNSGTISSSSVSGYMNGGSYVGGLVGSGYGTISNSSFSGTVLGVNYVGGLAGINSGTISNSYVSSGSVTGTTNYIGGLAGSNNGQVNNSHYDIDKVAIQGNISTYVTLGGLYDGQYTDWLTGGLKLNIANYASSLSGSGNNYTVNSVQGFKDLLGFADNPAYNFMLTADVDLGTAAGLYIPYLAAKFSGNNHTISNLSVNQSFNKDLGMFGDIALNGTVSNLILSNAVVTGLSDVGALAGLNQGTISNSSVIGASYLSGASDIGGLAGRNDGTIGLSYISGGTVSSTGSSAGGLVGSNRGTINQSYAVNSTINGGGYYTGGLVGENWGNTSGGISIGGVINNSYASNGTVSGGTEVGGLVGYSRWGSISNSYVTGGTVTGIVGTYGGGDIGGLVGYNNSVVDSSYVTGGAVVKGTNSVGGLIGYNDGSEGFGAIVNSHVTNAAVTGANAVGGLVGYMNAGFSNPTFLGLIGNTINNSYVSNGTVTATSSDAGGLVGYNAGTVSSSYVSGGSVSGVSNVGGLAGYNYATTGGGGSVGIITTSYVSNGSVTGNNSASNNIGGLVGSNTGVVNGDYVIGGSVSSAATDTAANAGGLVGNNSGSISNSYVSNGSVSSSLGSTSNWAGNFGGLVGLNSGNIDTSFVSSGSVFSAGTSAYNLGGLVGDNSGTISNTYTSNGTVSGNNSVGGLAGSNTGSISNSYASNGVVGSSSVGGLVGNNGGTVTASFWNTTVAGVAAGVGTGTTAGVIGMNDINMRTMTNFNSATVANGGVNPGWNISNTLGTTWTIVDGVTMPLLSVFTTQILTAPTVINQIIFLVDQHEKPKLEDFLAATKEILTENGIPLPMCN